MISSLYPYQIAGYRFLQRGSGVLAFDMGLGKTATAIAGAIEQADTAVLVVCPRALKAQWVGEIVQVEALYGNHDVVIDETPPLPSVVVTTKASARHWTLAHPEQLVEFRAGSIFSGKVFRLLHSQKYDTIIVDECHRFSNPHAKQSDGLRKLAKKTKKLWGLTGTLVRDTLENMYGVLNMVDPAHFRSRVAFISTYCETFSQWGGIQVAGPKKHLVNGRWSTEPTFAALKKATEHVVLVRTLEDVGIQLPEFLPPMDIVLEMNDDQAVLYRRIQKEAVVYLDNLHDQEGRRVWDLLDDVSNELIILNAASRFGFLQRVTSDPDHFVAGLDSVKLEWLKDYVENGGAPAVIFTRFRDTASKVDQFLRGLGRTDFLVNTYDTLAEGHNLQHYHVQIRWDLPLKRQHDEQASKRLHRIGQQLPVQTFRLLCRGTVDVKIARTLEKKQDIVTAIIEWLRDIKKEA